MIVTKETVSNYLKELVNLQDHVDTEAAAQAIEKNVHFRGPNVFILFFAIVIASVGLNVNSTAVIIGAMLVSPLMGPIIGFGLGVGTNNDELVKSSLRNLAVMVGISVLASTLYFSVTPLDLSHPTELLARTNPSIYDVFIALFGGFAGILETSKKEKGTVIPGVAIATALMPPLCTVGYGIASLNMHYALGAFYLFLLNSILIALAAYIGAIALHYKSAVNLDPESKRRRFWWVSLGFVILLIPSVFTAFKMIRENDFARTANMLVEEHPFIGKSFVYKTEVHSNYVEFFLAGEKCDSLAIVDFYSAAHKLGLKDSQVLISDRATTDSRLRTDTESLKELNSLYREQKERLEKDCAALRTEVQKLRDENRRLQQERDEALLRLEQYLGVSTEETIQESEH